MKTPDEIKKWLECCVCIDDLDTCQECPYYGVYPKGTCIYTALKNYVAYVRHLESSNAQVKKTLSDNGFASLEAFLQAYSQVKAERDALIERLRESKACCVCANRNTRNPNNNAYDVSVKCIRCVCGESQFEWRGVCEENGGVNNV